MLENSSKKKRGAGIVKLGNLFDKYKKTLKAPEGTVKHAFIRLMEERFPGVAIKEKDCSYTPSSKTLTLRISGMIKTEILLHKEEILKDLRDVLGEKSAPKTIL